MDSIEGKYKLLTIAKNSKLVFGDVGLPRYMECSYIKHPYLKPSSQFSIKRFLLDDWFSRVLLSRDSFLGCYLYNFIHHKDPTSFFIFNHRIYLIVPF